MKATLNYSQNKNINNNLLLEKRKHQMRPAFKEQNNKEKYNNRPAQAISFGGSAGLKGTTKAINALVENKGKASNFVNNTVKLVNENEAAYNAIYSMLVAGILKPIGVLSMPGSEEKDKQIVATKNFLNAFLGSFLSLTIGGGFVKKSVDVVKNNLKLINVENPEKLTVFDASTKKAQEIAKTILEKEENSIGKKFKRATQGFKEEQKITKKIGKFFNSLFKDKQDIEFSQETIEQKAKSIVKNLENNHLKIFQNNGKFVELLKNNKAAESGTTYMDAFDVLWKNSAGIPTVLAKAKISSLLLPGVMAFLFAKKNLEKAQQEKAKETSKETTLANNSSFKNQQEQFQKMMNINTNNQINFKGNLLPEMIDKFAQGIEKMGMSKPGEKAAKLLAKTKKPSARMADIESFAITAYWLQNTARSKKIEPSQKLGLNVHSALVTAVSSTAAFIIDWACDGLIDKTKETYKSKLKTTFDEAKKGNFEEIIENNCKNMLDGNKITQTLKSLGKEVDEDTLNNAISDLTKKYGKKLSKFKSLTIFTLVVRFLVPVLMVPFSGKLKKKIIEWTDGKPNNQNKAQKTENK